MSYKYKFFNVVVVIAMSTRVLQTVIAREYSDCGNLRKLQKAPKDIAMPHDALLVMTKRGYSHEIDTISSRARNNGLLFKVLAMTLLFFFASIHNSFVLGDSFDKTVEDLIYEKITDPRIAIELQYESQNKVAAILTKESDIKSISLINFEPNHSNFKIRVNYTNNSASDELFGKYISFVEVPVLSRFIRAGEIITDKDITIIRTKLSSLRGNFVINEKDIIGMQAKKHLSSGALIKNNELINPPVIKTNDPVSIIYSSNNIKLKISGTALNNGAIGDMVKVKNNDTGAVLLGQIINKNTVQVGGE
jgi:flagella basal body P-ring formation protein FlgA